METVKDEENIKEKPDLGDKKDSAKKENDNKLATDETELDQLRKTVDELKKENDQLQDQFLRSQAEIANMNNRFKKERSQLLMYSGQELAQAILPGVDNLKRALDTETDGSASEQLKKGIEMVLKQLNEALKNNQITEISESGVDFDPTIHQAVSVVEAQNDEEKNTVKQILQSGYKLKDRVIRPAMVVVTK
jgi:molecular chaperone GrpE